MDRRSACGTCLFHDAGRCRRFPTSVVKAVWDFCGEFRGDPDKMCRAESPPKLPDPVTSQLFEDLGVPRALSVRSECCILMKDHEGLHSWEET